MTLARTADSATVSCPDVLAEVGLGGGLDAIGAAPEVDRVEVALEDLVLGQVAVDLDRDDHLAQLAVEGAVLGEEVVLDVLLGDRRPAALDVGAAHGLPHRAGDAAWGDPGVGVEVAVLGGDDRALHGHRHAAPAEPTHGRARQSGPSRSCRRRSRRSRSARRPGRWGSAGRSSRRPPRAPPARAGRPPGRSTWRPAASGATRSAGPCPGRTRGRPSRAPHRRAAAGSRRHGPRIGSVWKCSRRSSMRRSPGRAESVCRARAGADALRPAGHEYSNRSDARDTPRLPTHRLDVSPRYIRCYSCPHDPSRRAVGVRGARAAA
jgi:hypothetical protein